LRGKALLSAMTTGGSEDAYCAKGSNRFSVRQLLAPIEQTARLCGMDFLPPFVVHGTFRLTASEIEDHAVDYRRLVEALRDGRVRADGVAGLRRLNSDLDALLGD
jgi:glutathione-regulated potassium-efflux system ancillary protein KefG